MQTSLVFSPIIPHANMDVLIEFSIRRLFPHTRDGVDKSRAKIRNFIKARQFISPSIPEIVPSRILKDINRKAKLMCRESHRVASFYQCPRAIRIIRITL